MLKESALFKLTTIAAIALLALNIGTAQAGPITYTLEGDAWGDRPFGTFTYDAGSGFSNVSIWSFDRYATVARGSDANTLNLLGDLYWLLNTTLSIEFTSSLGGPGTIAFTALEQGRVLWWGWAKELSGNVTGANVPSPSAALLMGLGIAGLLLGRRMRARAG